MVLPLIFAEGWRVTYSHPWLNPSTVQATYVRKMPDGTHQVTLAQACEMIDPQTGETFPKAIGEIMYGKRHQVSLAA